MTRRRFHRTMEMILALPWWSKRPSVSILIKQSRKQGDARGTDEVRHGTSSIHFHCPAPRSSSHIGHGVWGHAADRQQNGHFSGVYVFLWSSFGLRPDAGCCQAMQTSKTAYFRQAHVCPTQKTTEVSIQATQRIKACESLFNFTGPNAVGHCACCFVGRL